MTNPYTYNQLIQWFSSFASNHYQINYFGNGDFHEAMESNQAAHKLFPILWVNPTGGKFEFPHMTTRFSVLVMDLVNKDESNENEVLSDMQLVMSDLMSYLLDPALVNNFTVTKTGTITPFTEKFSGWVTGWQMDIEIQTKWQRDRCQVPASGAPSIDNVCRPVTIYDTDGNVVTTVASGGSYIITACAAATVKNSDNTFNQSVASGATYTLADTTTSWYLNGVLQTSTTVASMVNQTFNINFV